MPAVGFLKRAACYALARSRLETRVSALDHPDDSRQPTRNNSGLLELSRRGWLGATARLGIDELVARFEAVAANPEEELVYDALRCIEPHIERLVTVSSEVRRGFASGRSAFHAKLRNVPNRIPLGVMGDGMWRMLALVLALVRARNGILLIDDIDTGLHHTVLQRMWKLIFDAGATERLNVQVFATTHSGDCVKALSSICEDSPTAHKVSIQRVERDASNSVVINEDGVIAVAERGIDVR